MQCEPENPTLRCPEGTFPRCPKDSVKFNWPAIGLAIGILVLVALAGFGYYYIADEGVDHLTEIERFLEALGL